MAIYSWQMSEAADVLLITKKKLTAASMTS
jgi:hypothetical protein